MPNWESLVWQSNWRVSRTRFDADQTRVKVERRCANYFGQFGRSSIYSILHLIRIHYTLYTLLSLHFILIYILTYTPLDSDIEYPKRLFAIPIVSRILREPPRRTTDSIRTLNVFFRPFSIGHGVECPCHVGCLPLKSPLHFV